MTDVFYVSEELKEEAEKELEEEIAKVEAIRKEALKLLDLETLNTVKTLLSHRDNNDDTKISLEASKHLSKMQGLVLEKQQVDSTIVIMQDRVNEVEKALEAFEDDESE